MATGQDSSSKLTLSFSAGSEDLCDLACEPCQLDGKLNEGVGMCIDCQEYLCQKCFDVHKLPTPLRNHKLLSKAQMLQSQISLQKEDKSTEKCFVHQNKSIKYYCKYHRNLGCSACITLNHRSCGNVTYIPHAAKDLINNEEYQQAESQLKSVVDRSRKIADNHSKITESLYKNSSEALKNVQLFRRDINEALDNIEDDLSQRCDKLKSEELYKLTRIDRKYNPHEKELDASVALVNMYQNNRQHCNLYIAMMKAMDNLKVVEEGIKEVEHDQLSIECEITFVPNSKTLDTLKYTDAFGKLSKSRTARSRLASEDPTTIYSRVEIATPTPKQEIRTIISRTEPTTTATEGDTRTTDSVDYIHAINVKSTSDDKTCNITGLIVLPDNRLLITDSKLYTWSDRGNGNVKLLDLKHDGQVITQLKLSNSPWDAAKINNNQVAITVPDDNNIALVTVTTSAISADTTLDVDGKCRGLDYRDRKLAVSYWNPHKIQVLTLQGIVLYTVTNKQNQGQLLLYYPQNVSFGTDETSLFVSSTSRNNVLHIKSDGSIIGTYTDNELKGPRALFTHSNGTVYVCGKDSHNVHQITEDCKKIRILLTTRDNGHPYAISYHDAERLLYVGMYDSDIIQVYRVVLGNE